MSTHKYTPATLIILAGIAIGLILWGYTQYVPQVKPSKQVESEIKTTVEKHDSVTQDVKIKSVSNVFKAKKIQHSLPKTVEPVKDTTFEAMCQYLKNYKSKPE